MAGITVKPTIANREFTYDASAIDQADGTDGQLRYTTVANDIDEAGHWHIQGKIINASGTFYSSIEDFYVKPNL